jgi:hypothetical protein
MKRVVSVVFVIAAIWILMLPMYTGIVKAYNSAYDQQVFSGSDSVIDGKWTTNTEWDDGMTSVLANNSGIFIDKYTFVTTDTGFEVYNWVLVEFFTDKTNDTGDYVQICYDSTSSGGSAPQTGDFRIDYVGHNGTLKTYVGTGTGWAAGSLSDVTVAELVSISKLNGTNPHWTAEFKIAKVANGLAQNNGIMVAVYDASNPHAGVQAWPPGASANVPDSWGFDDANALSAIPEGLGIGSMVILASVAVLVGFFCLRKWPKTGNSVSVNLGK